MQSTQIRPQKAKATPKTKDRGATVGAKSRKLGADVRPGADPVVNPQERELLIAQAAYFRAEKRGFAPGGELQDWIEAEAEILRLIGGR